MGMGSSEKQEVISNYCMERTVKTTFKLSYREGREEGARTEERHN